MLRAVLLVFALRPTKLGFQTAPEWQIVSRDLVGWGLVEPHGLDPKSKPAHNPEAVAEMRGKRAARPLRADLASSHHIHRLLERIQ
jgi:hypothetical protein